MATVIKKGNLLHIQWYDPIAKQTTSRSTGLAANDTNLKKAKVYAKKLQEELTRKNKTLKQIGSKRVTIKEAFEHFLRNNQNKHTKTIKDYDRFYKRFTQYFNPKQPCVVINKIEVERWLFQLKAEKGLMQNTIHGYGKQCYHFLNFLFEYSYTPMFKINKEVKTHPEVGEKIVFNSEHIEKIFNGLNDKNDNFKLVIHLLFYTGLRSSDILSIDREKVDLTEHSISYYSPKRKKYRVIPFHSELLELLRDTLNNKSTGKLINYSKIENLGKAINRYFVEIGIISPKSKNGESVSANKKVNKFSARTFRKSFISLCRSHYQIDATIVRELVGHEHANTTDKYYNQVPLHILKQELEKFKRPQS
jgi:integrase